VYRRFLKNCGRLRPMDLRQNLEGTRGLRRWVTVIVGLRFGVYLVRAFLPLGLPEIWRQTDTLGVALRYWSRWTLEPGAHHLWLPAVLNSGDTEGIMGMEFPILNLMTAPFFALGVENGRIAAHVFLILVLLALVFLNARVWRGKRIGGVDAETAMLLLPLISLGADWSGKFMPDFLSLLLICLSLGLSWDEDRPLLSFGLGALGLLMKPTAVAGFALCLLKRRGTKFYRNFLWILPAIAVGFFYYTVGIRWIQQYQELPNLFAVEKRQIAHALWEYFSEVGAVLKFLAVYLFFPFGGFAVVGILAWESWLEKKNQFTAFWILLILQLLVVAGLGGGHARMHPYYFLAITIPCAFLFTHAWAISPRPWCRYFLVLGLCLRLVELSHMDLRSLYRKPPLREWMLSCECQALKKRHPDFPWKQGRVFRSTPENFPQLGLCFGERQGSNRAAFGFFYRNQEVPSACHIVDKTVSLVLAKCP
jgi:hypothetical protein